LRYNSILAAVRSPSEPLMWASPVYVARCKASSYLKSFAVAVDRLRVFFLSLSVLFERM